MSTLFPLPQSPPLAEAFPVWPAALHQQSGTQITSCCCFEDIVDFSKNVTPNHPRPPRKPLRSAQSLVLRDILSCHRGRCPDPEESHLQLKLYVVCAPGTTGSNTFFWAVNCTEFLWILSKRLPRPVLAMALAGAAQTAGLLQLEHTGASSTQFSSPQHQSK